jgi:ABC-2 type transport system permease protein
MWVVAMGAIVGTVGVAFNRLYPTLTSRRALLSLADSPVLRSILGPLLGPETTGGLVAWRMGSILVVILGLATTFLVVRHTRAEEQHGRGDLVAAAPVGRGAPVLAALVDAAALDAAAAVAMTLALLALSQNAGNAVLFACAVAASAWCFGAVAAIASQFAATSKAANGVAASVIAVAFLLRALGELYASWLVWLSPLGWVGRAQPFATAKPAVLALPLCLGVVAGAAAVWIAADRERGRGLRRERPPVSHPMGGTPRSLAWRLERTAIVVTLGGAGAYSIVVGSIVGLFNTFAHSSPTFLQAIERLGGTHVLEDAFTTTMAIFGGVAMAAWAVSLVLRLHTEEEAGRVQLLVGSGAPRVNVFDGYGATAIAAGVAGTLLCGLGLGIGRAIADHKASSLLKGIAAGAVVEPAMLVLVAFALLAVGLSERSAAVAWGAIVWCAVVSVLGSFLGLPQFFLDLSPFTHVPALPLHGTWWVPMITLTFAAVVGVALGRAAYGRRPIGGA